jgi:acetoin utilization protein AcuB
MRLADIMTRHVHTIRPSDGLDVARRDLALHNIHHLVVTDGHDIVGVLAARDVATRGGDAVADVMTPSPVVVGPRTSLREAANLLRGRGIGCLPVVDGGKLVGIVTIADLLDLIGKGATKGGNQLKPMGRRGPRRMGGRAQRRG